MNDRTASNWAVNFCMAHFDLPEGARAAMWHDQVANDLLWTLWQHEGPDVFYNNPLQILRQECYRIVHGVKEPINKFFEELPEDAVVLDYGCGTAEFARKHWYDLGREATLIEPSDACYRYLHAKYKDHGNIRIYTELWQHQNDAIICLDVFEHIPFPLAQTKILTDCLKPGGQALFKFSGSYPHPGHLPESIAQMPEWGRFIEKHYNVRAVQDGMLWLEKKG